VYMYVYLYMHTILYKAILRTRYIYIYTYIIVLREKQGEDTVVAVQANPVRGAADLSLSRTTECAAHPTAIAAIPHAA
jgi:hypothetical protein